MICEIGTYSLLPCAVSMWQTTFLILRVALLGNCKTFQRLPVYQCFKRQLINVICIWAIAYVNIDWESLEECSQLDSQEQHFSKAVVAQLGNVITKFGLLLSIDIQWSFLLLFPIYFPPCFWIHSEISALSLEQCKPSWVLVLPHTLPNPHCTDPCLAAALQWAHTSAFAKEGPQVSYVLG